MKKNQLKTIGTFILNLLEIYIPFCAFIVMFSVFVLQIFYRYILNNPLTWTYEVTVLGFLWTTLLGACYVKRLHSHISFDLVYYNRTPKGKMIFRLIGNGLVVIGCIISLFPTYKYLLDMHIERTPVIRIPFSVAFLPVIIFFILIFSHSIYDIIIDIAKFKNEE